MSQKELQRLKVIENAVEGKLTTEQAAALLGVSVRQVKRYKAVFRSKDHAWVLHGNQGRKPGSRLPEALREQIVQLAKGKYKGFNDTHLCQKLLELEKIVVSRETLPTYQIHSPQQRRPRKYRTRRERKALTGPMVLLGIWTTPQAGC